MRLTFRRPVSRGLVHTVGAERRVSASLVDLRRMAEDLTVLDRGDDPPTAYELWRREGDVVVLPRNYPVPWRRGVQSIEAVQRRYVGTPYPPFGFRPQSVLRDRQAEAYAALRRRPGDKILTLGCGKGKTVLALHYLLDSPAERLPALIVVPTTALLDQWVERISQHTTVLEHQIGLIQGGVCRRTYNGSPGAEGYVAPCPLVVGMLKTFSIRDFDEDVTGWFRAVVFDEAHRCAAPLLGRAVRLFPGERLSLTATPERDDGMDAMFRPHLGPVVYRDTTPDMRPVVYFLRTGTAFDETPFSFGKRKGRLTTKLAKIPERNALAARWIQKATAAGRVVLVLGERKEQLTALQALVPDSGLFTGELAGESQKAMKARRAEAMTKRVTLATSILGKEGIDRAAFDAVVILQAFSGRGRLDQTMGRALRLLEGKRDPVVLILQDATYRTIWSKAWKRPKRVPGSLALAAAKMREHVRTRGYDVREAVDRAG